MPGDVQARDLQRLNRAKMARDAANPNTVGHGPVLFRLGSGPRPLASGGLGIGPGRSDFLGEAGWSDMNSPAISAARSMGQSLRSASVKISRMSIVPEQPPTPVTRFYRSGACLMSTKALQAGLARSARPGSNAKGDRAGPPFCICKAWRLSRIGTPSVATSGCRKTATQAAARLGARAQASVP